MTKLICGQSLAALPMSQCYIATHPPSFLVVSRHLSLVHTDGADASFHGFVVESIDQFLIVKTPGALFLPTAGRQWCTPSSQAKLLNGLVDILHLESCPGVTERMAEHAAATGNAIDDIDAFVDLFVRQEHPTICRRRGHRSTRLPRCRC